MSNPETDDLYRLASEQRAEDGRFAAEVRSHVACAACGYDLHRLHVDSSCPECGHAINSSILSHQQELQRRPRPLERSDPKWLKSVGEGAFVVILALILAFLIPLIPTEFVTSVRVRQNPLALVAACVVVVVASFGAWKVTTPETLRRPGMKSAPRQIAIHLATACVALYPAAAALITLLAGHSVAIAAALMVGLLFFMFVGQVGYYVSVASIIRRTRSRIFPVACIWCALVNLCFSLATLLPEFGRRSAVGRAMGMPTPAFGRAGIMFDLQDGLLNVVANPPQLSPKLFLETCLVLYVVSAAAIHVDLLRAMRIAHEAATKLDSASQAGGEESAPV